MIGQQNRFDKCSRCALIARTKKDVSEYFGGLREDDFTARRLYRPVPDEEVAVLALCNTENEAEEKMNAIIRRETQRIRESWSEHDYMVRSGRIPQELELPTATG